VELNIEYLNKDKVVIKSNKYITYNKDQHVGTNIHVQYNIFLNLSCVSKEKSKLGTLLQASKWRYF